MTVEPNSSTLAVSALRVRLRVLIAAFALAVAAAGCVASLGEIRAKPAERVLVAPGRYGDLGGCVATGLHEAPAAGLWGFVRDSSRYSSSKLTSKWSSMADLPRPVTMMMLSMPDFNASSTPY